ncbi:hypothetical protein FE783_14710 [Paenibacillus mesophilus]|uniref:hypothetical protein n=1 Tax=Paenibacillus mesophilus TaxID=2582849 RepID=UPI00110DDC32|nr:hypothetical protein [Paenibacillus mesophilus]TMV48922.1 hypothetical protein FE783_14710 [Paenibacillus mesophilus]
MLIDNFVSNNGNLASGAIVTDNGQENMVLAGIETLYRVASVVSIDRNSVILDGCAEYANMKNVVRSGFDKLVAQSYTVLFETGIMPVGEVERFKFEADSKQFRYRVYCYDENRSLLNDKLYINGIGGWKQLGDYAGFQTNVSDAWVVFSDKTVKYANIVLYYYGPGSFEYARLKAYVRTNAAGWSVDDIGRRQRRPLVQAAKPVKGLVHPGHTVAKSDGTGLWICVGRADTIVSTAQSSGTAALPVADAAGMSVGDVLAVCLEDRTTQWTSVSAISGNTVTISETLAGNVAAGAPVAAIRWV